LFGELITPVRAQGVTSDGIFTLPHEGPMSTTRPRILIIGTIDTKSDEIGYLRDSVAHCGGTALIMDVGVLGTGPISPDISNADVAAAAGVTLQQVRDSGDENSSMTLMARGASNVAVQWQLEDRFDGILALGGTMGTDLALDVANALPLGVPKVVLSTVAYSHLIPAERVAPDLIMRLWAGGLYGLNSLCKTALAQAAGAAVGACLAQRTTVQRDTPVVGMTSLGLSALKYMQVLKPELEQRGYEVAVFHTTGMGGRAFEELASKGYFAAVMDFSLQELANHLGGSCVTAGADRLLGAGRAGVPQIVAPGATDMVDFPTWAPPPQRWIHRITHAHNRLIASQCIDAEMRREVAREIGLRLAQATGPNCLILPKHGIEEWDRPGEALHDPEALQGLVSELPLHIGGLTELIALEAHINDDLFMQTALQVFDRWVEQGVIRRPGASRAAIQGAQSPSLQ
jgi:uncharacterized protein (UPF0261 family)